MKNQAAASEAAQGIERMPRIAILAALAGAAIMAATGCSLMGETRAVTASKPAHHRDDGGFRNPPGSPVRDFSQGVFASFIWGRLTDDQVHNPPETVMLAAATARNGLDGAANPSVTWLGHAAFLIRIDGKTILTDPYLGNNAGPLGFGPKRFAPPPLSVEDLPPIDFLLLSHNHYDHMDRPTLAALPGKETMTVLVPLGLGRAFLAMGYRNVVELDWWQGHTAGSLTIQATPAVHFSGRGLFDRNRTLWASFAIHGRDGKLWFSGDTAPGAVFEEIGQRAGPFDLAMVGIGAYEPRAIMKSSHATPEEAIGIVQAVGATKAIGMHWGTVKLTPEDPFEAAPRFKAAAEAAGYGAENAWIMKIGETRNLDPNRRTAAAAE